MISGSPWSKEEDDILFAYYPKEHGEVSKRLPGRSVTACRARASILGVAQLRESIPEAWSKKELDILHMYYPTEGAKVSKRLPGRSEAACRLQAAALGIRCSGSWTDSELAILRQYYPTEGRKVFERLPGRSALACYSKARQLNLPRTRNRRQQSDS